MSQHGQIDRSQYADARRFRFFMAASIEEPGSKLGYALDTMSDAIELIPSDTITEDQLRACVDGAMDACGWPA